MGCVNTIKVKDGSFYIGSTNNIERRLQEHSKEKFNSYSYEYLMSLTTATYSPEYKKAERELILSNKDNSLMINEYGKKNKKKRNQLPVQISTPFHDKLGELAESQGRSRKWLIEDALKSKYPSFKGLK